MVGSVIFTLGNRFLPKISVIRMRKICMQLSITKEAQNRPGTRDRLWTCEATVQMGVETGYGRAYKATVQYEGGNTGQTVGSGDAH